ncbi:MAG: 3-oxoacyl-ACP reductase FabG [Clostridia bacterium]|nr:3-oxoacyl-ACP reductase FabG [Clostridia bacterium]
MLEGKIALISGASRGIGLETARRFIKEGAKVAVLGNNEPNEKDVLFINCDVSDFDAVKSAVAAVVKAFGRIDICVNNAGITRDNLVVAMLPQDFDDVYAVNLRGAFNLIKAVSPFFIKSRFGRIINISSVAAVRGNAGQANYCAAKAGLIGLTKCIARELAPRNVTCNAVAPGFIETAMTLGIDEKKREALLDGVPLKRAGSAKEVAALCAFLASDEAGYITGSVIPIDGGMGM